MGLRGSASMLRSKDSLGSKYPLVKNFFHKWNTWEKLPKGRELRELPAFPPT